MDREKLRAVLEELSNTDLALIAREIDYILWCRGMNSFAEEKARLSQKGVSSEGGPFSGRGACSP